MRRALVGAVASLLALSCATVPSPSSARQVMVLTGTVTDSATSQPLRGMIVSLLGSPVRVATGQDGRYHLSACLARGTQVVLGVASVGYRTKRLPVRVDSDTVRVNARVRGHATDEDEDMERYGENVVFAGTVTDANSMPLPNAIVSVGWDSVVAGPDGRYRFVSRAAIGSRTILSARHDGYYTKARSVRVSSIRTWTDLWLTAVAPDEGC